MIDPTIPVRPPTMCTTALPAKSIMPEPKRKSWRPLEGHRKASGAERVPWDESSVEAMCDVVWRRSVAKCGGISQWTYEGHPSRGARRAPWGGGHSHGSWQEVGEPALPRPHPVRHNRIHPE
jgi:hypothetical protein